jgi:3-dehydroquinate synthase
MTFLVPSRIRDYEVRFEESPDFIAALAALPQTCFAVDENVWSLYRATLLKNLPEAETIVVPIGEDRKSLETVQWLYKQLLHRPAKRNLTLVCFGGGILQDVIGFAASTLYRGIRWIFAPTTLLAQADSCIGSKTSLNFLGFKNLLGTFYPPAQIHIYPPFLATQADEYYLSGVGEVIKLHLMGGRSLYEHVRKALPGLLSRQPETLVAAIEASLHVKLDFLTGDEFDTGRRNLLNYGHDFGHALETTSGFALPHGQAVLVGMLAANLVARNRSLLLVEMEQEIAESVLLPALMVRPRSSALEPEALIDAMKQDKKRTGDMLALIMMTNEFVFQRVNDLTPEEVYPVLKELGMRLM